MTADRRDWVEVGCEDCGKGIRGLPDTTERWLENHICLQNSGEEKNLASFCKGGPPRPCETCVSSCGIEEALERSVSPSNETRAPIEGIGSSVATGFTVEAKRSPGHPEMRKLLDERWELHKEKSGGYGTGADPFANFRAVSEMTGRPAFLYPIERTVEKITRIYSLYAQGRLDEIEEELRDGASCLDCSNILLREDLERERQIESGEYA